MQEAAFGEMMMERMSITTWFVCRLVITEYTIKLQQYSPFGKKLNRYNPTIDKIFMTSNKE